jgi:vacuolar-type H+-ATPase subunit H
MKTAKQNMAMIALIDNLESQVDMHQVLLEVLNQANALPASCELLALQEVHSVRDAAVWRIEELETQRRHLIETIRIDAAIEKEPTLKEIVRLADSEQQTLLLHLRHRLNDLIEQIRRAGRQNAEQAVARIACFRELHGSIHKSFNRHAVYSVKGMVRQPRGAVLLNRSI